jgi:hypothetical protein
MKKIPFEVPGAQIGAEVQLKRADAGFQIKKIGEVEVDSGRILILDPCEVSEIDSIDLLEAFHCDQDSGQVYGQSYPDGQQRKVAVISETGIGDGRYPVFATIVHHPALGKFVSRIEIWLEPPYSLADDPHIAKTIAKTEKAFLRAMNKGGNVIANTKDLSGVF